MYIFFKRLHLYSKQSVHLKHWRRYKLFWRITDWTLISFNSLSEDFIREFKDKVKWQCISHYSKLSEDFIREFKDDVDWFYISASQTLSEDFIREFKEESKLIGILFQLIKSCLKNLLESLKILLIGTVFHIDRNYQKILF